MYKLLIADDEQLEREAIRFIVRQNFPDSFEIREAANGREALEITLSFAPDLIFFDIQMPGINGLQAAAQIKKNLPECRIIIVTAYHYFNYAKDALSLGADEYITKPAPVETVVATVRKVIAAIEAKRAKERSDEEKERRLKQIAQYIEDNLLVLIAYGEIEEKEIEEYLDILNSHYQAFLSVVAAVFYQPIPGETVSEIKKGILNKRLVEWLKSYFQKIGYHAFIHSIGQEIFILLLFEEFPDEYKFRLLGIDLFTELNRCLAEELQSTLSIGIGRVYNSVHHIYQAFSEAKRALRYETEPGSIISYGDIQKGHRRTVYPQDKEERLSQCIYRGDRPGAEQLLEELLKWALDNFFNLEIFRQKVYEMLLALLCGTYTNAHLTEFDINTEKLSQNINLFRKREDICHFAEDYLLKKLAEINTIKTSRANALLNMAIDYMERNFSKDLSLEEVASFIQISPFYLSKIFKKEIAENFIDYLTRIRIQKAQQFLANPLLTIKDVCYQVGYRDPNYFARVFKKTCGITPTEYQSQNRSKE
jgi:Response regulator containing CheY-like receiver domain and AraC-type DNA-binding domain